YGPTPFFAEILCLVSSVGFFMCLWLYTGLKEIGFSFLMTAFLACSLGFFIVKKSSIITSGDVIVNNEGKITHYFKDSEILWKKDPIFNYGELFSKSREYGELFSQSRESLKVEMQNQYVIIANDVAKIRNIKYTIEFERLRSREEIQNYLNTFSDKEEKTFLTDLVFEFNKLGAKEISGFYNPNTQQQKEFDAFVREIFEPQLDGSGIVIKKVAFEL
ncbi:MAG: hypothetical protein ABFQ53_03085, partial [Patescibacteria group bacterium]